jgi:hypothetical protein
MNISGVYALTVFDDGGGPALYAGGEFTTAGGSSTNNIAKWDGASWSALGSGMNHVVRALTVLDDGGGPALHPGGRHRRRLLPLSGTSGPSIAPCPTPGVTFDWRATKEPRPQVPSRGVVAEVPARLEDHVLIPQEILSPPGAASSPAGDYRRPVGADHSLPWNTS